MKDNYLLDYKEDLMKEDKKEIPKETPKKKEAPTGVMEPRKPKRKEGGK